MDTEVTSATDVFLLEYKHFIYRYVIAFIFTKLSGGAGEKTEALLFSHGITI